MFPSVLSQLSLSSRSGRFIFVAAYLLLLSACAPNNTADSPVVVKAVVITMFEHGTVDDDSAGELQLWVENSQIAKEYPFDLGEYPLYYTKEGVLIICVGGGIPNATSSIMALGLDPRFDLTKAYWLVAGIAGGDPQDISLGSAVWARSVVDGDLAYEIDAREIPDEWPYGYLPLGGKKPAQTSLEAITGWTVDTIKFDLNAGLAQWAYEQTKDIKLNDTPAIKKFRELYTSYPNAQKKPSVSIGETLSSSTYWHGEKLNQWANDWVKVYAGSDKNFVTSNMEDSGSLTALHRLARLGIVDTQRLMILRTVSNYTMPPTGKEAAWSTTATYPDNGLPALEAAYSVARHVLDILLDDWSQHAETIPTSAIPEPVLAPEPNNKLSTPVIFDTDMAIDDWATTLFLQRHPNIDLIATTISASGETHCESGEKNLLALLDLSAPGTDVPVACGDEWALDGYFVFPAEWQKDADTLSGVTIQASTRSANSEHAVELIHTTLTNSEVPVVLLATGPMTNIAQWLEKYPGDVSKVSRLVIMGGSVNAPGNIIVPGFTDNNPNKRAEWNFYVDPLAADKVLQSGMPIEMVGLDVTNHVQVTTEFAKRFKATANTPAAKFWDAVLDKNGWFIDSGEYYFWDVLAAIVITDRETYCQGELASVRADYKITETPWLPTSDMTIPETRWDGAKRNHLAAINAGVVELQENSNNKTVKLCMRTQGKKALDLFLQTLND